MLYGPLALLFAGAFTGAALYLNLVEQPARLALDDIAMLKEWGPSDRRGFAVMAVLALLAGAFGIGQWLASHDVRWAFGALAALVTWPYAYFALAPMNNRILSLNAADGAAARAFILAWGRLEIAQTALGVASCAAFVWALASP